MKRRVAKGESVLLKREDDIKLDFYGCTALLRLPEEITRQTSMSLFSPASSPVRLDLGSLPPSSPPLGPISETGEDDEERQAMDRSSSPLSPMSDKDSDLPDLEVKAEMLDEIVVELSPPRPVSRTVSPVKELPPIPADLDLPALIASTVVFSGSSKLSQPDLVKHMLEASQASKRICV
jgi:hypothetical protein